MQCACDDCPISQNGILINLLETQKQKILCLMEKNKYKKKQVVFLEGNANHYIFAVKFGRVKVYKTAEDGKDQIIKIANIGDFLAFDAIYSKEYHYSAETIEDAEICMIEKKAFIRLVESDVDLAIKIIKVLARDLEILRCALRDLTTKTASQKLSQLLLSSSESFSSIKATSEAVTLALSRKELAEMLGLSTETVSRTLSQFERDHLVKITGKEIIILDRQRLSDI